MSKLKEENDQLRGASCTLRRSSACPLLPPCRQTCSLLDKLPAEVPRLSCRTEWSSRCHGGRMRGDRGRRTAAVPRRCRVVFRCALSLSITTLHACFSSVGHTVALLGAGTARRDRGAPACLPSPQGVAGACVSALNTLTRRANPCFAWRPRLPSALNLKGREHAPLPRRRARTRSRFEASQCTRMICRSLPRAQGRMLS